jgi:anhydro-N-acetylmuramic acid kinase
MVYRAIGLMSGSSLDGLDIAFAEIQENGGKWTYEILQADCYPYSDEWIKKLKDAVSLPALAYQLLHAEYGHYLGQQVNRFIRENQLEYKVSLVASHGHTTFHIPARRMTAQLGDGAAIAASTELPVVSDLRSMDIAFGGEGAPIVPIGEKLLLGDYDYFLNIGGIANISAAGKPPEGRWGFDVCAANRVLNMLAAEAGKEFDDEGKMAAKGNLNEQLMQQLNKFEYYDQTYPKSLANDFGTDTVYPVIKRSGCSINDALRTYTEHIALQIKNAIIAAPNLKPHPASGGTGLSKGVLTDKLLCTGGGALNTFLMERLSDHLNELNIEVIIPGEKLIKYKEALIMALIGVLRWREETNVLASVTGAKRDSIGGAVWMGQEE